MTDHDSETETADDEDGRINERLDRIVDILATYLP